MITASSLPLTVVGRMTAVKLSSKTCLCTDASGTVSQMARTTALLSRIMKNESYQRMMDEGYRLIWNMKIGVSAGLAWRQIIRL